MRGIVPIAGICAFAAVFGALLGTAREAAGDDPGPLPEHPAIRYGELPAHDAIAELNRRIASGTARLKFDRGNGYLRPVLEALGVPEDSQISVYSKTSFQTRSVSPWNPRMIYFNDSIAIAWVRGEWTIEAAAQDPQQGVVFYQLSQTNRQVPQFHRQDDCLGCHLRDTGPGLMVRSVAVARDGSPLQNLANFTTDHTSPIAERWGGWYVTGKAGGMPHLGNRTFDAKAAELPAMSAPQELATLDGKIDSGSYPSKYSDIAALIVFEHQVRAMNLITYAGWVARWAAWQANPPMERVKSAAYDLADYLLFAREAPLRGRMEGGSGFTERFSAQGPHDHQGRSLRQLDLTRRVMRYPCSYMIYSAAFEALPQNVRTLVYARMWQVLSGGTKEGFEQMTPDDRRAIVEILRDTKKGLPGYWSLNQPPATGKR
jgi:hypothetical protein